MSVMIVANWWHWIITSACYLIMTNNVSANTTPVAKYELETGLSLLKTNQKLSSQTNTKQTQTTNLSTTSLEYNQEVPEYMKSVTSVLVVLHCTVFVVGLIGNLLVCLSVYRQKSLQTITNHFIVNLAIADFLVILICLPPTVYWDLTLTWYFGLAMCKLVLYLQSISVSVSVITLTCISIDRWYAICRPLQFNSTKKRAKVTIVCIWLISMLIACPDVIFLITKPLSEDEPNNYVDCTYSWPETNTQIYQLCIVLLLFIVPFILMSVSYSQIVAVLWRNKSVKQAFESSCTTTSKRGCRSHSTASAFVETQQSINNMNERNKALHTNITNSNTNEHLAINKNSYSSQQQYTNNNQHQEQSLSLMMAANEDETNKQYKLKINDEDINDNDQKADKMSVISSLPIQATEACNHYEDQRFVKLIESRRKAAKMLIVIMVMFGLCYLPVHFLNLLRNTVGLPQNDIITIVSLISHWLCYFNSAINPIIYNVMNSKFRKEFSNFICCKCFDTSHQDDNNQTSKGPNTSNFQLPRRNKQGSVSVKI